MVPRDWLRECLSTDEVRALDAGGRDAYEAGVWDELPAWADLKGRVCPRDEVWRYCSPLATWEAGQGELGVAIVRAGAVVATAVSHRSQPLLARDG
jgi:hypothetical protein